jgi:hypothetical protein
VGSGTVAVGMRMLPTRSIVNLRYDGLMRRLRLGS